MKRKQFFWLALVGVMFLLAAPRSAWAVYATNSVRINDWHGMGCFFFPGSAGSPGSGVGNAGGNQMFCPICQGNGMPGWWVEEPYINLHISDVPLSYFTSSGKEMSFRFLYKQRYELPKADEVPSFYYIGSALRSWNTDHYLTAMRNFGMTNAAWSHNWMMNIVFWDNNWEANWNGTTHPTVSHIFEQQYEAFVSHPEGGVNYFLKIGTQVNLTDPQSQIALQPLSSHPTVATPPHSDAYGIYWGDEGYGFELAYPDGSKDVFNLTFYMQAPAADIQFAQTQAEALLTQRVDPQGRTTALGYDHLSNFINPANTNDHYAVWRVKYVVDPDGRTNTFNYETNSPKFAWQLKEIIDPYGRKVSAGYDGNGRLQTLVDAVLNTNSFSYQGNNGWITNMTTPYGTTAFSFYQVADSAVTNGFTQRATYVSEPGGAGQMFYFNHINSSGVPASTTSPTVPGYVFDDGGTNCASSAPLLYYRNSFHWDRRQFAALSSNVISHLPTLSNAVTYLTAADYKKAHLNHWMLAADNLSLSESLSAERDPSPDATGATEGAWSFQAHLNNAPDLQDTTPINTFAQIAATARLLPNNTSQYVKYNYFPPSVVLDTKASYTLPNGTVTERTNFIFEYSFTNTADLLSVTNSLGQRVKFVYNSHHQVTNVVDAINKTNKLTYHPDTRNLTGITFSSGATIVYTYYDSNDPPTSTSGRLHQVEYEPQGRFVNFDSYTNGMPKVVRLTGTGLTSLSVTLFWDALNRPTGALFPDTTTTSNVYTKLDLTAQKDRLGHWTYFGYDDGLQHLTSITDASNNVTLLDWCGCGALSTITDASNKVTQMFYDNQGKLTNILFPDTSSLTYQYDLSGRMKGMQDGSGRAVNLEFNNQGMVTKAKDTNGTALVSLVYDILDRAQVVTGADGVPVTNAFDDLGRLSKRSWASNIFEGYTYDTNGLTAYTNVNQKVTHFERDNAGRLLSVTNANQEVVRFGYDAVDRVRSLVDGLSRTNSWDYNEYGLLKRKVDPLGHEVLRLLYDANGQVTNRWTPAVTNTSYTYDVLGNLKTIAYPGNGFAGLTFDYDLLGQLKTMVDGAGSHAFTYTRTGQLESEDGPWSADKVEYGYSQGQRTSLKVNGGTLAGYGYDSLWRLTNLTSVAGAFSYTYAGSVSELVQRIGLPNGAYVSNHFDALKRLDGTALVNYWGHVLDGYSYGQDALGLRTNITRDLGLTTNSVALGYDDIGQLTSWSGRESGGTMRQNEQLGWGYDAANNLHLRTNGTLVQTFGVEGVNELTNISRTGNLTLSGATPAPAVNVTVNGNAAERYGDLTFARTNVSLSNGTNTFTIIASNTYNVKTTNVLTLNLPSSISFLYDSNGNLTSDGTRTFAYDGENQLTNVSVANAWKTEFVYDGFGRRRLARDYTWTGAWTRTAETRYVYDGMEVVQERDSNNVVLVTYTRGLDLSGSLGGAGGIGGLLARTDGSNVSAYYHSDGAGNVTALMDGQENVVARYLYDPFGRLTGKWGEMADVNRYRFSSKEIHANSGMYYYGLRFYEPTLQRWLTQDPIGEAGGINLYGFVRNRPNSYIDPQGSDVIEDFGMWELDMWDSFKQFFTGKPGWEYKIKDRNTPRAASGLVTQYTDEFGNDITKDIVFDVGVSVITAPLGGPKREAAQIFGDAAKCEKVADIANVTKVANRAEHTIWEASTASRGFKSFEELKKALGPAGEGKEWHHIVEQSNIDQFGAYAIHNVDNVIAISAELNQKLNVLYSKPFPEITGSTMTIREWLKTKTLQQNYDFGRAALHYVSEGTW